MVDWLWKVALMPMVLVLITLSMPYEVGARWLKNERHLYLLPCPAYARSAINISVFTRNAMLTIDGYQVVGYFDSTGDICLVRRHLSTGVMERIWIANPMTEGSLGDAHRTLNMGYSTDGLVHMVFGAHGDQPFYFQLRWPDLTVISQDVTQLHLTSERITYPQFYDLDGHLILVYRDDANRSYSVNRYDSRTGEWSQWLPKFLMIPSDVQSVYLNSLGIYQQALAIAYTLRLPPTEDPPEVLNEDLRVITSQDGGVTWREFDGRPLSLPITAEHPSVTIRIPAGRNLCNQAGAWLGPNGVFRVAYYADDEHGVPQVFVSDLTLFPPEVRVSKITDQMADFDLRGRGTLHSLPMSRPVVLGVLDQVVVIWRQDNTVKIATRPDYLHSAMWREIDIFSGYLKNWEPVVDFTRVSSGTISLFIQGAEQGDADTNSPRRVDATAMLLDVELD
jgi:hypothetical protein